MKARLLEVPGAKAFRKQTALGSTLCALVASCGIASVAMAATPISSPLLLTPVQLDRVTAGGGTAAALVEADAGAGVLALTKTSAAALVTQTNPANPAVNGSSAAAGGIAQAVAVGPGATTNTGVQTSAAVDNIGYTQTYTVDIYSRGLTNEMSGGGIISFGTNLIPL